MTDSSAVPATTDRITEAVRKLITDYALDQESLHASWRCGYPEIYGPCNCVDEFVTDATSALAVLVADAQTDAWLAGRFAEADARGDVPLTHSTDCPYRKVSE